MNIQLISASNPRYSNSENTSILLDCEFSHYPGEVMPFNAMPNDVAAHGRDVYARAVAGEFGPVAPYILPPVEIPKRVTMRQARLALSEAGLLDDVNAAIVAAGGAAVIEWEYATEVRRSWPLVATLASALNMTEVDLDALFSAAAQK